MFLHLVGADEDLEIRMHRDARRRLGVGDRDDGEDLELGLLVEKDVGELAGEKTIALQQEVVTDAIALLAGLEHGVVELAAVGELQVGVEVGATDVPVLRLDVEDAILLEHEKVDLEIATLKLPDTFYVFVELGEPAEHGAVDRFAL